MNRRRVYHERRNQRDLRLTFPTREAPPFFIQLNIFLCNATPPFDNGRNLPREKLTGESVLSRNRGLRSAEAKF